MKKQFGIRIEEKLIERAKKLAEKNKKNFQHPQNYNAVPDIMIDFNNNQRSYKMTDDLSILDQPNPEARARNEYSKSLKLTTDHSASSYDIPVLVGNDDVAYGISDFVELLHNSARNLARALYEDGDTDLDTYCRFTQSDPNYKGDIDDLIA